MKSDLILKNEFHGTYFVYGGAVTEMCDSLFIGEGSVIKNYSSVEYSTVYLYGYIFVAP
jgi:hypothetical protein